MEIALRGLLIAVVIYGLGAGLLTVFQRGFLYFPRAYVNVPTLEEVSLTSSGTRLHGYVANSGNERLLLYFGGNAEQIAVGIAQLAEQLPDTTIIGFDYRGYGKSEGQATEERLYRDALAQFDAYRDQFSRIGALGRSLGSTVAVYLATQRPVDHLVLVTPVDSVARIAAKRFWFYPVRLLLKDHYDALSRAGAVTVPVLMLAAAEDHLVAQQNLNRLKNAFSSAAVELVNLAGVGHNTIQNAPEFYGRIRAFLEDR